MSESIRCRCVAIGALALTMAAYATALPPFAADDVFELEWIDEMDVAASGDLIVYVRAGYDRMTDRTRTSLWSIAPNGSRAVPLVADGSRIARARIAPQGDRVAFVASNGDGRRLRMLWLATGAITDVAQLTEAPQSLSFSPDGERIAFLMRVAEKPEPFVKPPEAPKGAQWAPPPTVIERLLYRADGSGYAKPGEAQVFVVPAAGGTPRQLTEGGYPHGGEPAWTTDGTAVIVAGNRRDDWEYEPTDTNLYRIDVTSREVTALTERYGPDFAPTVSPDGRWLAYLGYDDDHRSHIHARVSLLDLESGARRTLSPELPGSVAGIAWARDGKRVYVQYDAEGDTRIASVNLAGRLTDHIEGAGGLDLSRPYSGARFDVGGDVLAFTKSSAVRPADLAVWRGRGAPRQLTAVNDDLLGQRAVGDAEAFWFESPADGRRIQGWIVPPPDFDASKKYPLLLEIHGGPHTNYGAHFAAEIQLYAAAGYVVVYVNPRGSTSYGETFANLIDKNYPSEDFDDLMGAVDAVIARGYIDERNLFVTGGSGGGVLTAWIVGKTDRFRAAVSAKPVINWLSFALTSDIGASITDRWFHGAPWLNAEEYARRSPLSLVGNVSTPTMVIVGEQDFRTPVSESEQYYQALKIRKVDTMLVRLPEASHDMSARPSALIAKVAHVLAWFERYRVRD